MRLRGWVWTTPYGETASFDRFLVAYARFLLSLAIPIASTITLAVRVITKRLRGGNEPDHHEPRRGPPHAEALAHEPNAREEVPNPPPHGRQPMGQARVASTRVIGTARSAPDTGQLTLASAAAAENAS